MDALPMYVPILTYTGSPILACVGATRPYSLYWIQGRLEGWRSPWGKAINTFPLTQKNAPSHFHYLFSWWKSKQHREGLREGLDKEEEVSINLSPVPGSSQILFGPLPKIPLPILKCPTTPYTRLCTGWQCTYLLYRGGAGLWIQSQQGSAGLPLALLHLAVPNILYGTVTTRRS